MEGKPQQDDKGFVDSGCSRHMTMNIAYLLDFKEFDGGYVAFGGGAYGGRITGKGTLKTDSLNFEDVYFVNKLKFNLFSVSQMYDKKNHVFFTDTECLVLSPNFKLPDENQILLKIPRKDNIYSFDMKNMFPKRVLTSADTVNTASPDVNTGSLKLNVVGPSVNTASSNEQDSPKDMFTMGASHTLEATHIKFLVMKMKPEEELLQFKTSTVWILVDPASGKKGHWNQKWVLSKQGKNERGIQIEAIRLFLAYAAFMGFKDPDHPDKVYKVVKALYGLHQAPRAWYETLANYLLWNGFKRGKIDQTLFIKKQKGDILLVQVYVDDIIFGSTNKELCTGFKKLIKDKFQMSSMGELTFFLGLHVQQKEDEIFISQDKYVAEILKKFSYTDVKSALTPVDLEKPLVKDGDANDVDVHLYRSMIGSLMYPTSSRPDIMFAVCACARFQVTPKTSHLLACKKHNCGCQTSTIEAEYVANAPVAVRQHVRSMDEDNVYNQDSMLKRIKSIRHCQKRSMDKPRYLKSGAAPEKVGDEAPINEWSSIRSDLPLDVAEGTDCLPTATIFEELARIGAKSTAWNEFSSTMASLIICLATNQKFNLSKYIFEAMVKHLDGGRKEAEVPQDETEHKESVPTPSNDPQPSAKEDIAALKKRVQRLERKKKSRTTGLKRLKKVGMSRRVESSEDPKSLGDHEYQHRKTRRRVLDTDEMHVEAKIDEKYEKDQVALDEQMARDVQAQLEAELIEEEKLARKQEEEANIALIESWDNT
ncbi:putative ribonuclease H-like domain-containing protein [Tanacetum coccineum]